MAKGSKRLRKKKQKQQQISYLKSKGISTDLSTLSTKQLEKVYHTEKQKDRKREQNKRYKQRQREKKLYERTQKLFAFEKATGIHLDSLPRGTVQRFDAVPLSDIEKGYITIANFPELFGEKDKIDFNKVYKFKGNKKLHIAFRALDGDTDISTELEKFNSMSDTELIKKLEEIKNAPLTGTRNKKGKKGKTSDSSGKAGESMIALKSQSSLDEVYRNEYNDNRRSNSFAKFLNKVAKEKGINFQHGGVDYYWQNIAQIDKKGRPKAYTELTPHKALVIANAIMWNIKETDRAGFYQSFYENLTYVMPIMKKILP